MQEIPQTPMIEQTQENQAPQPINTDIQSGSEIPSEVVQPEKKNNKWLMIGGMVALVFILLGGVFAYQQYSSPQTVSLDDSHMGEDIPKADVVSNNSKIQNEGEEQTVIEVDNEMSDWETYSDNKLGISFKHPASIQVSDAVTGDPTKGGIQIGKLITITPYEDRLSSKYYEVNPEIIQPNNEIGAIVINGQKYTFTKSNWEDGAGGQGTQQLTYFIDIPQRISIDLRYQKIVHFDNPSLDYMQVTAPNGDFIKIDQSEIDTALQILSTFEFVEEDSAESISDEEIILVKAKEAYEKQFPENSQFFNETKVLSSDLEIEGEWAFGKITPPRDLVLYVAHKSDGKWEVAVEDVVEGNEMYTSWFQQLPDSIVR